MALGLNFPIEYRREQIVRRLVPGVVFKMRARMDDGRVKEKRFVLLRIDADAITCVINSELTGFVQRNSELLRCQVSMQQAEHEFMDHDSHVDCSQARAYPADAVINELLNHPDWVLGDASKDLKEQMVAALKYAPMIAPADVPELCDALLPPDLNIG